MWNNYLSTHIVVQQGCDINFMSIAMTTQAISNFQSVSQFALQYILYTIHTYMHDIPVKDHDKVVIATTMPLPSGRLRSPSSHFQTSRGPAYDKHMASWNRSWETQEDRTYKYVHVRASMGHLHLVHVTTIQSNTVMELHVHVLRNGTTQYHFESVSFVQNNA